MTAPTVINMRNFSAQQRTVLIGNIIRLSSTIVRGTTWGGPQPVAVAKRENWTIKSADKYRALVDMVNLAKEQFGYKVESGTTVSQAFGTAKATLTSRKAAKKSKKLV